MSDNRSIAAWVPCSACEDFLCTIHKMHVSECICPEIDDWAARGVDPYTTGGPTIGELVVEAGYHLDAKERVKCRIKEIRAELDILEARL